VPFERPKLYPEHPQTLGDHIRKERLESGLTKKTFGALLHVDECRVYNWKRTIGPTEGKLKSPLATFPEVLPDDKNVAAPSRSSADGDQIKPMTHANGEARNVAAPNPDIPTNVDEGGESCLRLRSPFLRGSFAALVFNPLVE
jgi:hypothetical protein